MRERHESFVADARRYFPQPQSVTTDTFEAARDRLLTMLREENRQKPPVERWRLACLVTHSLIQGRTEPHRSWAIRILEEDLTHMLTVLHSNNMALNYKTTWPNRWVPNVEDCPF